MILGNGMSIKLVTCVRTNAESSVPWFCRKWLHFNSGIHPQVNIYWFIIWFFVCLFLVFRDRISLYSPGCPGTHFVDQAGLELRNLLASASWVLGLKACTTTPGYQVVFLHLSFKKEKRDIQWDILKVLYFIFRLFCEHCGWNWNTNC